MISRDQAQRIAAAVSTLRPDWPATSITTLITGDLKHWSLIDVGVGLAYVALDRKPDGTWASRTPGRVREQGPWRVVGIPDPETAAARARAERDLEQARADIARRVQAVDDCGMCDDHGRLPKGAMCAHDPELPAIAARGAAAARAAIRPTVSHETPDTEETR